MAEHLELHIPYHLHPENRAAYVNANRPHEIIQLQVPRIHNLRAAYYHDLLHTLWTDGYGAFTPHDIFALYPDQENQLQAYLDSPEGKNLIGGNIKVPYGNSKYDRGNPDHEQKIQLQRIINHTLAYRDITAYMALPRETAIRRRKLHYVWAYGETLQISEAEYWLRDPAVHAEFNDDGERMTEYYQAYLRERIDATRVLKAIKNLENSVAAGEE